MASDPYIFNGITYSDTGCRLHPSCLECPRPECYYDLLPGQKNRLGRGNLEAENHTREIWAGFRRSGQSMDQAVVMTAEIIGVTKRTVFRHLERGRKLVEDEE